MRSSSTDRSASLSSHPPLLPTASRREGQWVVLLIALTTALGFTMAPNAPAHPSQIILLRHGEKPGDPAATQLSARGRSRAQLLVKVLGKDSPLTSNAPIAALYATGVTPHGHGHRTRETLEPLSVHLGLPIYTPVQSKHYARLAIEILANSAYRDKTVVICWNHTELSKLAGALGIVPEPPPWKESVYDRLWILSYNSQEPTLREVSQPPLKSH